MISVPLPDLRAWTLALQDAALPVLASTAAELALLAQMEEAKGCVDAHLVGEAIEGDPLMTVKLLSHLGRNRHPHQNGEAETVVAATMMMGIGPFFQVFQQLESVEDRLAEHPAAWKGLQRVLNRSYRGARFALAFAAHRMDSDAMAVHEAALLQGIAEMMLWIHAPDLALALQERQRADPHARSAQLQREILNVRLCDLQHSLMQVWQMPTLLIQLTDPSVEHALIAPQRETVHLAVRLARHSAVDWLDPAVPDDVRDIAEFLTLSVSATQRLLHRIDA
jgi:HD-like signal output (HDOD) protein